MDYNLKQKAAEIINEYILTPVIYMFDDKEQTEFVCFCDLNIESHEFVKAEERLCGLLRKPVVLMDMREYDEVDRMGIISDGELIYSAHPLFAHMFERTMIEDARMREIQKSEMVKRYNASGSAFLQ